MRLLQSSRSGTRLIAGGSKKKGDLVRFVHGWVEGMTQKHQAIAIQLV